MPSYQFTLDPRRRFLGRTIASVRRELQHAYAEEKVARKFTQAELARVLEVNRSVVNRQLMGTANLTVKSLADLAWALGRRLVISFPKPEEKAGANERPMAASPTLGAATPWNISVVVTAGTTANSASPRISNPARAA